MDHFEGLLFVEPVPAIVTTGGEVSLSADVLDTQWQEVLFSFRPTDGVGAQLDFFVQHVPGSIERSIVFTADQANTYDVVLFAGEIGGQLQFQGTFGPFVVLASDTPVHLPEPFFDGILLDAPLSTELTPGAPLSLAGQIMDKRIVGARLYLSREGVDLESISTPLLDCKFDLPVRPTRWKSRATASRMGGGPGRRRFLGSWLVCL